MLDDISKLFVCPRCKFQPPVQLMRDMVLGFTDCPKCGWSSRRCYIPRCTGLLVHEYQRGQTPGLKCQNCDTVWTSPKEYWEGLFRQWPWDIKMRPRIVPQPRSVQEEEEKMDPGHSARMMKVQDEFDKAEEERKAKEPKPKPEEFIEKKTIIPVTDSIKEFAKEIVRELTNTPDPLRDLKNMDWRQLQDGDLVEELKGCFICWRRVTCANGSETPPEPYALIFWEDRDATMAQGDLGHRAAMDFGMEFKNRWDSILPNWLVDELEAALDEQPNGYDKKMWFVYQARMGDGYEYFGFTSQEPKDRVAQLHTNIGPKACRGRGKATLESFREIWGMEAGRLLAHYVRTMRRRKAVTMAMVETWCDIVISLHDDPCDEKEIEEEGDDD